MTAPSVSSTFEGIQIKYGEQLHVHLVRAEFLGFQSWIDRRAAKFCIEYTMKGGTILTEYDRREHFDLILKGLGDILW